VFSAAAQSNNSMRLQALAIVLETVQIAFKNFPRSHNNQKQFSKLFNFIKSFAEAFESFSDLFRKLHSFAPPFRHFDQLETETCPIIPSNNRKLPKQQSFEILSHQRETKKRRNNESRQAQSD
jgi:hypothetical protein